jgi:hypothetical protein
MAMSQARRPIESTKLQARRDHPLAQLVVWLTRTNTTLTLLCWRVPDLNRLEIGVFDITNVQSLRSVLLSVGLTRADPRHSD